MTRYTFKVESLLESEASVEKKLCPKERISKEHRSFASPPHPAELRLGLSYLGRAKRAVLVRAFILTAVQMFELKIVCLSERMEKSIFASQRGKKPCLRSPSSMYAWIALSQ